MTEINRGKYIPEWECFEKSDQAVWERLCELEPRLIKLYKEIMTIKDDKRERSFCANRVWYGQNGWGFKQRFSELVGWGSNSPHELLHTKEAYDVAYRKLYSALPDCRNCSCFGM